MKQYYTKLLFFGLLTCFGLSLGFGQTTTIYTQDFETLNSGYTASSTQGTVGSEIDIFNRSNPNIGGNSTFLWAVEDTNATPATITLDQINVTGYSDFTFFIDLLAHHYNDWDSSDEMSITYSIDGGASQNLLWVRNSGGTFNEAASLDTDFDGIGDCGAGTLPALTTGTSGCSVTSNQFATFSSSTIVLSGNTTLDIVIAFEELTANDEGIYLDNIEVKATPSGPPASTITATPNPVSGLGYVFGNATSTIETISIEGANLDNTDVTLTLPTGSDFEIAETSGGTYSNSITLATYDGSATDVFVRLKTGLAVNSYSDDISITGGGLAGPVLVTLNGEVTPAPPANDDCSNAIALVNNTPAISGTLEASTVATPFSGGPDVWYSFTPSYNETYTISLDNFSGDADLYLYDQSSSCPTSTTALSSSTSTTSTESISENLGPGTTYYIRVVAFDAAAEDTFDIQITAPPETTRVIFATSSTTVNEGDGTVDVNLSIINEDASNATNVDVVLTSGDAADIDGYMTQTITFTAGSATNKTITFTITDDAINEGDETLTFTLQNATGGNNAQIGAENTFDLTISDNDAPSLIITEVADPGDDFDGRFVEIYNNGDSPIDLGAQQIHVARQANGGNFSSVALTGTLKPDHLLVIGNSSNINAVYGFNADVDFGDITGNGDDGYFIYYNGDEITGTLLDAYGVVGQDGTGEPWEYEDSRAIRNNPKTVSPTATWTSSQWTITTADVADMTPGELENEFRYKNGWLTSGDPSGVSTSSDEIKIIEGTAVITSATTALNTEVKAGAVLDLDADLTSDILFKSDDSGSAQLADATGATITGEVTVERYIPANRAYRLLSSPVTTSGTIFENWQENGIYPTSANGIGTHITGFQGTVGQFDASSGLDQTASGNPSMFTFDNTFVPTGAQTQFDGWDEVASTNQTGDNLIAETPYLLFVRGDRSIDLASNSSTPNNTTLSATGNIFTGLSTQTLSGQPQYFSLVANPFQAIVDFNALTFTGLGNPNFMYVYDPAQKDYVTLQTGTNDSDMFIRPGQSVFVVNSPGTATASTVQFEQTDINTSPSPGPGTTVFSDDFMAKLELELYNGSGELRENLRISFEDNASNAIDEFDAPKLTGGSEILASVNSGNIYTIERRAQVQSTDQVSILLDQYQGTDYEFRVKLENWNPDVEIFVADSYLVTTNQITPDQAYVFTVDSSIPESISENRFSLVFDNTTLGVDDNTFGSDFALYPNPTTDGQFSIKTTNLSGEVTIEMTNLLGQNVYSQDLVVIGSQVDVNAQNISTGIYVVKLTQGNQSFSTKLIVE